jgi:DNA-binding NarL/FixJ family response regulator
MTPTIPLIVVDDHSIFRAGLVQILSGETDFDIVGEGACADDAVALARTTTPRIALIDVSMPGGGIAAARALHAAYPALLIVMLTVSEDEDVILEALDAGAAAYALKGVPGPELVRIIRTVLAGEPYLPPSLAVRLLTTMRGRLDGNSAAARLTSLTEAERRTLRLLAKGFSNRDIAEATGVSIKTVKFHVSNVLSKLGLKNRVEAALIGQSNRAYDEV